MSRLGAAPLALLAFAFAPADGADIVISTHSKPSGYIVDSAIGSQGNVVVLQRDRRQATSLIELSEYYALKSQETVAPTAYLLVKIPLGIAVASVKEKITVLEVGGRSLEFPGFLNDMKAYQEDDAIFMVAVRNDTGKRQGITAWRISDGITVTAVESSVDSKLRPKQLISNHRAIYMLSDRGLHRLRLGDGLLREELAIKGKFNGGSVALVGQGGLAAMVSTKIMVQSEVELWSIMDGKSVKTLKYPYSIVSATLSDEINGHVLLLTKSKESLDQAELTLLTLEGIELQRKKIKYHSRLTPGSRNGAIVLVSPDEITEVRIAQ